METAARWPLAAKAKVALELRPARELVSAPHQLARLLPAFQIFKSHDWRRESGNPISLRSTFHQLLRVSRSARADSVPVNSQRRLTVAPQGRSTSFNCSRRYRPAGMGRGDAGVGKALPGGRADQLRGNLAAGQASCPLSGLSHHHGRRWTSRRPFPSSPGFGPAQSARRRSPEPAGAFKNRTRKTESRNKAPRTTGHGPRVASCGNVEVGDMVRVPG